MKKYEEYKLNKLGGTDPQNKQDEAIYKKFDLITLPADVEGTNCFNCRFIENIKGKIGFCSFPEIQKQVTKKNCCAEWDHKDALRDWKN